MTLAPLLYTASPVEHLRPISASRSRGELGNYSHPISTESRPASPAPAPPVSTIDISRPSSTSTQASTAPFVQQHQHYSNPNFPSLIQSSASFSLPGLSALASIASAPSSQLSCRSFSHHATPSMNYGNSSSATASLAGNAPVSQLRNNPDGLVPRPHLNRTSPITLGIISPSPAPQNHGEMAAALSDNGFSSLQPVCQNCQTSTTPLWRRDEMGSVLCNACGLFLKLHGRSRPISLKTDVIKSRNRVKSAAHGPRKKPPFETNGLSSSRSETGTPPFGSHAQRVSSHKASSGTSDQSHSPVSRTGTPQIQHDPNIAPQHIFDGVTLNDQIFHPSPSLPSLHLSHPSPGSISSLIDRHLEPPQTYDQLLLSNNQLKTRVNELELINMMRTESEVRLQKDLDKVRQSEGDLKRRLDELERQRNNDERNIHDTHPSKRSRLSEPATYEI